MKARRVQPREGPSIFEEILEDLPAFWSDRDLRTVHHPGVADAVVVVREDRELLPCYRASAGSMGFAILTSGTGAPPVASSTRSIGWNPYAA